MCVVMCGIEVLLMSVLLLVVRLLSALSLMFHGYVVGGVANVCGLYCC